MRTSPPAHDAPGLTTACRELAKLNKPSLTKHGVSYEAALNAEWFTRMCVAYNTPRPPVPPDPIYFAVPSTRTIPACLRSTTHSLWTTPD